MMADTKIRAEIEARLRGIVDVANRADPEGYASYHTADCTVMYQDTETVHGREAVKECMKRVFSEHGISSSTLQGIDYLQVLSDNKVYSTVSFNSMDNTGKTVAKFRIIMLWRKEDGKWLIERKFQNFKELPPQAQAQAAIKAQMVVLYDAFTRNDLDTLLSVYVDEATWSLHGLEDVKGKQAGREAIQQVLPSIKTMVLDEIFYFELFGDDVAHTNAYINLIDERGKVYNRVRDNFLWKKVDGKWLIQRDAFNEVPVK